MTRVRPRFKRHMFGKSLKDICQGVTEQYWDYQDFSANFSIECKLNISNMIAVNVLFKAKNRGVNSDKGKTLIIEKHWAKI